MKTQSKRPRAAATKLRCSRAIVLVGMMGAGKTTVGRRLARRLALPFFDVDEEIEKASGLRAGDLFVQHGEESFRRGEAQIVARLLAGPPHVMATGGGAILSADTRRRIRESAISVWIRADIDTILRRAARRDTRPLLRSPDPRATLERLLAERETLYAEADIAVDSAPGPHWRTVDAIVEALAARLAPQQDGEAAT